MCVILRRDPISELMGGEHPVVSHPDSRELGKETVKIIYVVWVCEFIISVKNRLYRDVEIQTEERRRIKETDCR